MDVPIGNVTFDEEGAADVLRTQGPGLFVELHEEGLNRFGTSSAAILKQLARLKHLSLSLAGYTAYWLQRSGPPEKASDADIHARIAQGSYVDVLFLKDVGP